MFVCFFLLPFKLLVSLSKYLLSSSYEGGIVSDKGKSDKSLCLKVLTWKHFAVGYVSVSSDFLHLNTMFPIII